MRLAVSLFVVLALLAGRLDAVRLQPSVGSSLLQMSAGASEGCCRICLEGFKPCGDQCVAKDAECNVKPGCACPTPKNVCRLGVDSGLACSAQKPETRFAFNTETGACSQFEYRGCGGNDNNFLSKPACEKACVPPESVCKMPQVVGPCKASMPRWWFNSATERCEQFTFGGCQGNFNNFETEQACAQACPQRDVTEKPKQTLGAPKEEPHDQLDSSGEREEAKNREQQTEAFVNDGPVCEQTLDAGTCNDKVQRFAYNNVTNICEAFTYTGCNGNENRFETQAQCWAKCKDYSTKELARRKREREQPSQSGADDEPKPTGGVGKPRSQIHAKSASYVPTDTPGFDLEGRVQPVRHPLERSPVSETNANTAALAPRRPSSFPGLHLADVAPPRPPNVPRPKEGAGGTTDQQAAPAIASSTYGVVQQMILTSDSGSGVVALGSESPKQIAEDEEEFQVSESDDDGSEPSSSETPSDDTEDDDGDQGREGGEPAYTSDGKEDLETVDERGVSVDTETDSNGRSVYQVEVSEDSDDSSDDDEEYNGYQGDAAASKDLRDTTGGSSASSEDESDDNEENSEYMGGASSSEDADSEYQAAAGGAGGESDDTEYQSTRTEYQSGSTEYQSSSAEYQSNGVELEDEADVPSAGDSWEYATELKKIPQSKGDENVPVASGESDTSDEEPSDSDEPAPDATEEERLGCNCPKDDPDCVCVEQQRKCVGEGCALIHQYKAVEKRKCPCPEDKPKCGCRAAPVRKSPCASSKGKKGTPDGLPSNAPSLLEIDRDCDRAQPGSLDMGADSETEMMAVPQ